MPADLPETTGGELGGEIVHSAPRATMGHMCGRFAVTTDPALLAEKIQAIDESAAVEQEGHDRSELQRRADDDKSARS